MDWLVITPVAVLVAVSLLFLALRNRKDRKDFEKQANNDYPIPTADGEGIENKEITG